MRRIDRRRLLQLSSAGAVAASTGGLATILAARRAPAYAQGSALHWLRWADFVPASDQLLRNQIAAECQKALGIKLTLEMINANDIQARVTSAVQSGSGPDIILVVNNWPQLYSESVADVSDVAEEIGKAQGGFYDVSRVVASDGKRWIAMPWTIGGGLLTNRRSWFAEVGYNDGRFPETWEEYRAAGKKLKAQGRPFGQTLGHTFGDAPVFWYPYLWSWGGKEVEADGKTVALNSKETVESVKFAVAFWNDCYDPGGLAWDDSSNNRALLAGTVSSTNNGASIYLEAKKKPETYLTETQTPLWKDIFHTRLPKAPAVSSVCRSHSRTWSWAIQRIKRAPRTSCAGFTQSRFTISGSRRSRASPSGRPPSGRTIHCGRMIRLCCRSARSRRSGGLRAMPGRPTGRRPRS